MKILMRLIFPAMTLTSLAGGDSKRVSMLGSMLFLRSVSGTRVISGTELKEVAGYKFEGKHVQGIFRKYVSFSYLKYEMISSKYL